jgi:cytidine deaminase
MSDTPADIVQQLLAAAQRARMSAYAPYSKFLVGAALRTIDGQVFTGCNVENVSYGLTMCAERVAVFKAISEGQRRFAQIAVAADTETLTPPCGACRQVLWELGSDLEVILGNLSGATAVYRLAELLPHPFGTHLLPTP